MSLGNITHLLNKIKPAVSAVQKSEQELKESEIEEVAVENVKQSISQIRRESSILTEMEEADEIRIIGAIYSVSTGKVEFI